MLRIYFSIKRASEAAYFGIIEKFNFQGDRLDILKLWGGRSDTVGVIPVSRTPPLVDHPPILPQKSR
jgi:hypothetical protein